QLPPIQGGGFFTEAEPDAMLTEVHRQARDDPIVRLSMQVRAGERLEPGDYGATSVVRRADFDPARALQTDQILVGRDATRLQRAHPRAPRLRRSAPARGRQAGVSAQQPPQGPVQRRPMASRRAADDAAANLAATA